ncbi:MAG: zf-TFIIB domain-containing protein [Elusimicrobia bacterium]|nr:zf-TFIIB domain-containing protein [Elusimicrobiota bacterium]
MPACPACKTEALEERLDRSGVAYDACPKCRGIWFDAGELSRIMGKPAAEGLLDFKQGERACVRCAKPMLRGGFINPMLVVDRCAPCGGLWLDASELRVVRQLLGVQNPTDAEQARPAAAAGAPPPAPAPEPPPIVVGARLPDLPAPPPLSAAPPAQSPIAGTPGWQLHGGFWLVVGVGLMVYGKGEMKTWSAITAAGGLAGAKPEHYIGFGFAACVVSLYFLFAQPADAADGYLSIFKWILTPRGYRRRRRSLYNWYD